MAMSSLEDLYERYSSDVYRFAVHLSGDRMLAEDITSETFLRAWSSRAPIRQDTVKAYLFTIARNVYRHELRRRTRHVEPVAEPVAAGPDPRERAEQADALAVVLGALRQLPEPDRAALLMHTQDGLPYEQIARTLGVSLAAVKVRVHRARLKLARLVPREVLP